MALADGLRLGGVFIEVRLDTSKLRGDMDALRRDVERGARASIGVSASGTRASGSGGGLAIEKGSLDAIRGAIGLGAASVGAAMATSIRPVVGQLRAVGTQVERALDGAIDQLARVSQATRSIAGDSRNDQLGQIDYRRATTIDNSNASIRRNVARVLGRDFAQSGGPRNATERLPGDVRAIGGVVPEATTVTIGGRRRSLLGRVADRFRGGAGDSAGATAPVQAAASQAAQVAAQQVAAVAAATAAATGQQVAAAAGTRFNQDGTVAMGGGYGPRNRRGGRRGSVPVYDVFGDQVASYIGGDPDVLPMAGPGTASGNFRRGRRRRSGQLDLSIFGDAARGIGRGARAVGRGVSAAARSGPGRAALAGVRGAVQGNLVATLGGSTAILGTLIATLPKLAPVASATFAVAAKAAGLFTAAFAAAPATVTGATIAIVGLRRSVGILGLVRAAGVNAFARIAGAIRRVETNVNAFRDSVLVRLVGTLTGTVASALTAPFRLGLRAIGLYDSRASALTNTLRVLHTVASPLRWSLSAPFRAATAPIRALTGSLRQTLTLATLIAPAMAAAFVGRGVRGASDLAEAANVTNEAFGTAAEKVRSHAREMADSYGLVEEAALRSSNTFGLVFRGMGATADEAARVSTELTKLTADMASFFNTSQEDAARAVSATFRGEFNPIERFGVIMRKSDINAVAEARGETSKLGQAMITLEMITRSLATASGDLDRTLNSNSNLSRELAGRFQNLATSIGAKFLPAVREFKLLIADLFTSGGNQLTRAISGALDRAGESARQAIHFARQAIANWGLAIDLMKAGFQVARENAAEIFQWLGDAAMAVMQPVGNLLVDVFRVAFDGVREVLSAIWDGIGRDLVSSLGAAAADAADEMRMALTDPIGYRNKVIKEGMKMMGQAIGGTPADHAAAQTKKDLGGLFSGFGVDLPAPPDLGDSPALKAFNDLVEQIKATLLRGDEGEADGRGPRGRLLPEGMGGGEESSGRSSRTGQLVGAEQLREIQNQDNFNKDLRERSRQTAENTRRTADGIAEMVGLLDRTGLAGTVLAVAAP